MELFLMTLTTGIMVGGIYALIALGWVLIYKCSGVLNLAMGELTLIGAYVSMSFYEMGIPFILSVVISLIIGLVLGVLTERIFLDRMIGEPVLAVIMVTVGLSFFFRGMVEFVWGTDTRVFSPPVFSLEPIKIGFLIIGRVYLWSFVIALILLVAYSSVSSSTPDGACPCRPRPTTRWRRFLSASAPGSSTPPPGPSPSWPRASGGRSWATSTA